MLEKDPLKRATYEDFAKYPEISKNFINIPGLSKEILIQ
jgi:hypothetical protein